MNMELIIKPQANWEQGNTFNEEREVFKLHGLSWTTFIEIEQRTGSTMSM